MATRVYGCSDDLIEVDGDVRGEVGYYDSSEESSCMLVMSDGTLLRVWYGKPSGGIWNVQLVHAGALFDRIEQCTDDDATPYSDVAYFRDGMKWAYAAKEWEKVQ